MAHPPWLNYIGTRLMVLANVNSRSSDSFE
jgi:hypothetical protein